MTKFKAQNKLKIQITKLRFCHLCFGIWINFVICALVFGFIVDAYALNLDKIKVYYLSADYKAAITEGEKMLATPGDSSHSDELYYILGLSYLKDGNYLRASDIFEIIISEFTNSQLKDQAKMGIGDTYFLRGDLAKAEDIYRKLLDGNQKTNLASQIYYRLSQISFQKGNIEEGREYADKFKQPALINPIDFYTVQVGCFTSNKNAQNMVKRLDGKSFSAYLEEFNDPAGLKLYRVRVGKLKSRKEAVELEGKLSQEGFPTRIFP